MSAFTSLSVTGQALFGLWALLLCLANIASAILASVKKRFRLTVLALLFLAPAYFAWQVIFDLSLFRGTDRAAAISKMLGEVPAALWLGVFAVFTCAAVLLFRYNVRYDKAFITPGAIKLFLDRMPCGVCCWRDNGRVLLANICMNRLCAAYTGSQLLNGNAFHDAVKDGIVSIEGKVWRISCRDFLSEGERLHEMIASDITAEYARTQTLEKDNAELLRLNRELGEYYRSIDEAVRRQEILQAKVNIHDEMNRLMLSTTAASSEDTATLDRFFALWEQNALLLCMEAEEAADTRAAEDMEKLASTLQVRIIWQEAMPNLLSDKQRALFFSAAREAVVNAVKHAGAKTVTISFEKTEERLICRFINDGTVPNVPIHFTGGLANLALLAGRQGASVSASGEGKFTLSLCFPMVADQNQPIG